MEEKNSNFEILLRIVCNRYAEEKAKEFISRDTTSFEATEREHERFNNI